MNDHPTTDTVEISAEFAAAVTPQVSLLATAATHLRQKGNLENDRSKRADLISTGGLALFTKYEAINLTKDVPEDLGLLPTVTTEELHRQLVDGFMQVLPFVPFLYLPEVEAFLAHFADVCTEVGQHVSHA